MSEDNNDVENSKKSWITSDILKILSALAVTIPLFLGYFQYQRTVQQDIDNNFRNLVEKLSSDKKENRLAGATNLGTIILQGGEYYNSAIDILINYVAIENDINVLSAIRGSLEKVDEKDYKNVIQQLLNLERNSFIYEYPLSKIDKKDELKQLKEQRALVTNFIALMLDQTREEPIEGLLFYQNSLNDLVLQDLNILKSRIENSAFAFSAINKTNFSKSKIDNTVFTYSTLIKCDFSDCNINSSLFDHIASFKDTKFTKSTFKDVFFAGSNLDEVDFTGVEGLKPIYFYKAKNLERASFDSDFTSQLKTLDNLTIDEYKEYIQNCSLTEQRIGDLNKTLNELIDVTYE